jgi:hypothetical protein
MARNAGQPTFGMFEITAVGLIIALTGGSGPLQLPGFLKIGAPLNLLTWAVGVAAIPHFFPF